MIFLELALYGIRNFSQLTRLAFKPGLNLIQGGNGSGKSTVCDVLLSGLSPISDAAVENLKPRKSSSIGQAGLIFRTKKNRVYRLIRDFVGHKSSLAELDSSNKFHVVTQEEEPIAKILAEETGGLPPSVFEGLFTMRGSWMPSSQSAGISRGEARSVLTGPISPPDAILDSKTIPLDRAQKQKRLDELKRFLAQGDRLAAMEDQLSDLQARSAESKRRLRLFTEKTDELSRLLKHDAGFETLQGLPEDFHLILETSAQQEHLKNEQLATIAEDEEFIKQDLAAMGDQPFFLSKFFISGGVLVVATLILMVVLNLTGLFQNLLVLTLLAGAGLMGYAGYLDFGKINKRKKLEAKLHETERQRVRVEAGFKKENAPCIELLKKTGCTDVAALKEKVKSYEQFMRARRELESQRDQFLGNKTPEDLQQEVDTLSRQISELETKLKESSTLPSDIYLIQEEARILEQELALPPSSDPKPKLDPLPVTPEPPRSPASSEPSDFVTLPLRSGLQTASIQSVLSDLRSELTNQMTRLIEKTGGLTEAHLSLSPDLWPILTSPGKDPMPWSVLSTGYRDLCHLLFHLAVVQILFQSYPFPLILDNPLSYLDPPHQLMVLDILREIAQNRQVLLLSSVTYPSRTSDHLITLK